MSPPVVPAGAVVLGAVAAAAGCLVPVTGHPAALVLAGVAIALVRRRPWVAVLPVVVLASVLSARAHAGLTPPERTAVERQPVIVVTDPRPFGSGVRADVRLGDRRVEAVAHGGPAAVLGRSAVGDRLLATGVVSEPRPGDGRWYRPRHVAGRLSVERLGGRVPARGPLGAANAMRSLLADGADAAGLASDHRALFLGMVIGDDRGQSDAVRERFRDSGLAHTLAVSGQNVAFVLLVVAPLLVRLGPGTRVAVGGVVLIGFVLVTRAEPSVLRATLMGGAAVAAAASGRPTSPVRVLAATVTVLLLVDPLLVHSVGFRLSVAATAGLVVAAGPLAARLPGPRWFRAALAVTVAAQAGVAPLLAITFGPVPTASVPANLLAGPAVGAVMVWGLAAGPVAGAVPGLAPVVHLPTRALLTWIDGVATAAQWAPLPHLGPVAATVAGALIVGGVGIGASRRGSLGR